jgi:hypothetical protein
MKEFKIRASQLAKIMGKPRDSGGLTARQEERYQELKNKEKLTEKQSEELWKLAHKKTAPEGLNSAAKAYVELWYKEQLYGRRKEFSNKYTEKGIGVEDQSIRILSGVELEAFEKNEEYRENKYLTGTPDIVTPNFIRDIKSSWDFSTFPLFETHLKEDYYYQVQAYMILFDKHHAFVDYVLADTPWHLIEREARYIARDNNLDFEDVIEEIKHKHIYDDVPTSLRVKSFPVTRDPNLEKRIEEKVKLCREYIKELEEKLNV